MADLFPRPPLQLLRDPLPESIPDTVDAFLERLGGPTVISLCGQSSARCRAVVTLLHGNEPSGTRAIFDYLKSGARPRVNTLFIIASVKTALTPPRFSHRMLPGRRDLNRCFQPPFEDAEGKLAEAILDILQQANPECLIDIHNTSGSGPAFAVSVCGDANHKALTSLFTNDLIVTDLRLGALMELSEMQVPTVTIECGGAHDTPAQIIAREGLHRYLDTEQVLATPDTNYQVTIFRNPIRLETAVNGKVSYSDTPDPQALITMPEQAEKFNYGTLTRDEAIAFLGEPGLAALSAKDHEGNERLEEFFVAREGRLYPRHAMKVFMVTTNPDIAASDCLFYFIACE
ncbi:MAG: succinylglutamate desuccinylase/aspartoacylase family protein [Oleiphilaceae bacterium]|nr:succinylglutamate desuccinylase/aspartoacylase family protein [Oleiphilaceae bacterium]